jgi:hypothetical protein
VVVDMGVFYACCLLLLLLLLACWFCELCFCETNLFCFVFARPCCCGLSSFLFLSRSDSSADLSKSDRAWDGWGNVHANIRTVLHLFGLEFKCVPVFW